MSLRNIYEQLGIRAKYENEIIKLNNRIIIAVGSFNSSFYRKDRNINERVLPFLIREVAFLIGESDIPGSLEGFFEDNIEVDDLEENILNLNCLLDASREVLLHSEINQKDLYDFIVSEAKRAIEITPIDIGYLFSGDRIIKKGAKELDEKLILDNLTWLSKYPAANDSFETSLKHYLKKDYPDAITNAYASLEGLVKTFLGKDKQLDNDETRKNLISNLGLEKD